MGIVRYLSDGLANLVSGAGTTADKRTHAFYTRPFISPEQIESAYRTSWMLRKGVDLPPFDMTRNGRDWQADEADVDRIEAEEKRLGLWSKLRQALVLSRLGGGLIVMGLRSDPTLPITDVDKRLGALLYLHVMNRWQVSLGPMVRDPIDPLFGQPAYFQIIFGESGKGSVKLHPSRVIAFRGAQNPNLYGNAGDEWFWGDPVMLTVQDVVKNAEATMNGFASLVEEAKVDTVAIPGLTATLATAEGEALITKRVTIANLLKSTHNTRILDAGTSKDSPGETWDTRQVAWTGMPDMIRVSCAAVAGAFDIPATRFLGKSPDGMNATGSGDEANYIAKIRADQNATLRPALDQIDAVMLPSAGVTITAEANYDFPPLQEKSELDEATIFSTTMTAVTALQATNAIPTIAFEKALQHTAVEKGWLEGLDGALAEVPEDERFPSLSASETGADGNRIDPSAMAAPDTGNPAKGGGQQSARSGGGQSPAVARRRAANDALVRLGIGDTQRTAILDALEVGEPADTPFVDAAWEGEERDDHGRWTAGGAIREHVTRALRSGKEKSATSLGKVSDANASAVLKHTGLRIAGFERVMNSDDIRHVINSHGDPVRETARHQVAIRKTDFERIPEIIDNAHTITKAGDPNSNKGQRLTYTANLGGHQYEYAELIGRGNKLVALKSMRKW